MKNEIYSGFEQGAVRPPNEVNSLIFRISRNCPWNKCTFCPLYKEKKFSLRPMDHIMEDINIVCRHVESLRKLSDKNNNIPLYLFREYKEGIDKSEYVPLHLARNWIEAGMKSIFIQDADSLVLKPDNLIKIFIKLKKCFPQAHEITTFGRSRTIVKISDEDLKKMACAGLSRVRLGLESGSDNVLKFTNKGCSKQDHIKAGEKIKRAGITLGVNVMPGLGGKKYSREHVLESADTINQINPDFIYLRSFIVPDNRDSISEYSKNWFEITNDTRIAKEILLFIKLLNGTTSTVKSDHLMNLFENVEGKLPRDKTKMVDIIEKYLDMEEEKQMIYQIGRRSGVFKTIEDLNNSCKLKKVEERCFQEGITLENYDDVVLELKQKMV